MIASPARARILLVGHALVLALLIALPLSLALIPAKALHGDMGAGAGTGDLSAAALCSLDRDLHASRLLPPHGRLNPAPDFLLASWSPCAVALDVQREPPGAAGGNRPADNDVGPTGAGYPLLR